MSSSPENRTRPRVVEVQSFKASHRPRQDARADRTASAAAPPVFHPPATVAAGLARRDDLVRAVEAAQLWLQTHDKRHPERDRKVAARDAAAAELRDVKRWLRDRRDEEQGVVLSGRLDASLAKMIRQLSDGLDRLADEGAVLTSIEQGALDRAATWLAAHDEGGALR